jgi:hypothetical protein
MPYVTIVLSVYVETAISRCLNMCREMPSSREEGFIVAWRFKKYWWVVNQESNVTATATLFPCR